MAKISRANRPLADVNVLPQPDGSHEVVVCFMPDPDIIVGEGNSKAFLALDASASMRPTYGFGGPFGGDPNYVEIVAHKLASILSSVTRSGKVAAIYWAVSPEGNKIEEIGEFNEAEWQNVLIAGPKTEKWGKGTKILPAIQYCVAQAAQNSDWSMGVIITDGIIEDEKDALDYCMQIGKELADGKRKPLKMVLIGIGQEVDEGQLERFDNMFEGIGVNWDLWSHGLVASMQNESDILAVLYGELMNEDTVVAPTGRVEDGAGNQIKSFADGLPGKFRFVLPKGEKEFVIKTASHEIRQDLSEAIGKP